MNTCTFECIWNEDSVSPTQRPTRLVFPTVFSEHPLLVVLREIPAEYRFSSYLRSAIARFLRDDILKFDDVPIEVVEVSQRGRLDGQPHAIPLLVGIRAPSDVTNFALSLILDTVRTNSIPIERYIQDIDPALRRAEIRFDTYSLSQVREGDTMRPTLSPTTKSPTSPPAELVKTVVTYRKEESSPKVPWAVWLVLALVIVFIVLLGAFMCDRARTKKDIEVKPADIGPRDLGEKRNTLMLMPPPPAHRHARVNKENRPPPRRAKKTKQRRRRRRPRSSDTEVDEGDFGIVDVGEQTFISGFPTVTDPPEANALVLFSSNQSSKFRQRSYHDELVLVQDKPGRDPTQYIEADSNPYARDPSVYLDDGQEQAIVPFLEEPEGTKIRRKRSAFASNSVHSLRRSIQRKKAEPQGRTSDVSTHESWETNSAPRRKRGKGGTRVPSITDRYNSWRGKNEDGLDESMPESCEFTIHTDEPH